MFASTSSILRLQRATFYLTTSMTMVYFSPSHPIPSYFQFAAYLLLHSRLLLILITTSTSISAPVRARFLALFLLFLLCISFFFPLSSPPLFYHTSTYLWNFAWFLDFFFSSFLFFGALSFSSLVFGLWALPLLRCLSPLFLSLILRCCPTTWPNHPAALHPRLRTTKRTPSSRLWTKLSLISILFYTTASLLSNTPPWLYLFCTSMWTREIFDPWRPRHMILSFPSLPNLSDILPFPHTLSTLGHRVVRSIVIFSDDYTELAAKINSDAGPKKIDLEILSN